MSLWKGSWMYKKNTLESWNLNVFLVLRLSNFGDLLDFPKYLWMPDDPVSYDSPSSFPSYFSSISSS